MHSVELVGTVLFGCAILHTFLSSKFGHMAHRYPKDTLRERFFHLVGEVEVVFGLWAGVFVLAMVSMVGVHDVIGYMESLDFTEPTFVFVIMTMAATRPVLFATTKVIKAASRLIPVRPRIAFFIATMVLGPLLGSFITEPAAMTVSALLLRDGFLRHGVSRPFRYTALSILLVNISIGGTLTHFAAPPVLMVAETWDWDLNFMMTHFGWKAVIAVVLNAVLGAWLLRSELNDMADELSDEVETNKLKPPVWLIVSHVAFLAGAVYMAHHMVMFVGIFLLFMGLTQVTHLYQTALQYEKSLLVALFLGGLVVLGRMQGWWIDPILRSLDEGLLFVSATFLTAITDNAALTYLGAQVEGISLSTKYALVAGAVTGGGLTVIANAPNPAGFAILKDCFRDSVINPVTLFFRALIPTAIAALCFWFLPSF